MWKLCRPAAVQQLQRNALRVSARASVQAWSLHANAAFASTATSNLQHVLSRTPEELSREMNKQQLAEVKKALSQEFTDVVSQDNVSGEQIVQLFQAGQKTRLSSLMLRAFAYLKAHFPEHIDFVIYGEVFRALARDRAGDKLLEVYEFARTKYQDQMPELIHRFGVVGKIELGDMEGAQQMLDDMISDGHLPSNDIYSRLMQGYAREKNAARVLEVHEILDPQFGPWHETTIDRVILSLGVIGEPEKAFEFYVNSSMKLNGGTLITLLSVCRHNNCHQQAADILENRKRFDLRLDARGYNAILETLEFLDRRDEIASILDEIGENGVRYDTKTKLIVRRNQDVLKGTYHDLAHGDQVLRDDDSSDSSKSKKSKKATTFVASAKVRELLAAKEVAQAAALADEYVRLLTVDDLPEEARADAKIPAGALRVNSSLARDAVMAYVANGEHDKVKALLNGFAFTPSKVGSALAEILSSYVTKNQALAYRAAKLMQEHGAPIHRVDQVLQLFRDHKDADASAQLLEAYLNEFAEWNAPQEDEEGNKRRKKEVTQLQVSRALNQTLMTLAENGQATRGLSLLDAAKARGLRLEPYNYQTLLFAMRPHSPFAVKSKAVVVLAEDYRKMPFHYTSDDFEAVFDSIDKNGVRLMRSHVANASVALAGGNKAQRLRLLEAYASVRQNTKDAFVMKPVVYGVLLQVATKEGAVDELLTVYNDALTTLAKGDRVPRDWEFAMISHLTKSGDLDGAVERVIDMPNSCGTYSYEGIILALNASITASREDLTKKLTELLESRDFKLTLADSYELVHLAKKAAMPQAAFDVIHLYERAHGRSTEDAVDHAQSRQSFRDKYSVRKTRSMYRTALKLCEDHGEWKLALAFSTKVNELFGFEKEEDAGRKDDEIKPLEQ
ncbi:hypothetical protein Poli38472_006688 [Pythium oligandrum]|uniref:Pentacotripeptide-repeat region of PRORP domain-containing protein n=1 Tax=Pythium oligandrum TaxID=41045 RepID=A0A8K1C5I2_PYTOL|nr:hypothetical protein Poli38472_006688 [Pythium oligandrum]|eukprot:TMW56678.1 hypothetical protein Poli38472_006688 [Pythium oligandrum]